MSKKVSFRTKSGKVVSFKADVNRVKDKVSDRLAKIRAMAKKDRKLYGMVSLNTSRGKVMARRRFSRTRRVYGRARAYYGRSRKNPNSELNQLMGVAAFALAKPTIDNAITSITSKTGINIPPEVAELLLAWKFKNKGGIIGSASKAAYYVSMYNLTKNFIPSFNLGSIFAGGTNGTTTGGDQWTS